MPILVVHVSCHQPFIPWRPRLLGHNAQDYPRKKILAPPLNKATTMLEGNYQGNLPQVPRAAYYGPKLLNMIGFLQWHTAGESYTPYQEATLPQTG
jgi:hypothetical protein